MEIKLLNIFLNIYIYLQLMRHGNSLYIYITNIEFIIVLSFTKC